MSICGLLRVRNEELIIEDTLAHFRDYTDHIVAYDDRSTDRTTEILQSFDNITVIHGHTHQPKNESQHRQACLDCIRAIGGFDKVLCFDSDERLEGDLPTGPGAYRFKLFDAYLTPSRQAPYVSGELAKLPRLYGPERRSITMLFPPTWNYYGALQREPRGIDPVHDCNVYVRHFGKALSTEHWEETCRYYSTWPGDYAPKWIARMGKAIHEKSDWGKDLYEFEELMARPELQMENTF